MPRRFASRYISTTIHLPCGEWLYNIIQLSLKGRVNGGGYIPLYRREWLYNIIQLSPKGGGVNIVRYIYRDGKRRGIYRPLFTDPERESCFSIYQIRCIKNASSISSSETFTKRRTIFLSVRKTVNIQGMKQGKKDFISRSF